MDANSAKPELIRYREEWLSLDGTPLDKSQLLELWKQNTLREVSYLDLHYKYANWYSAFFIALFTAYAIGFSQFYRSTTSLLFLTMPIIVLVLAQIGKKAIDRFYISFLEAVME